jgi:hypothetical protein
MDVLYGVGIRDSTILEDREKNEEVLLEGCNT